MSVILIKHHNESIYDVIKEEIPKRRDPPKYKSIHRDRVQCERDKVKDSHRHMGYAKYPQPSPKNFLKKHTGVVYRRPKEIDCEEICKTLKLSPKPSVPNMERRSALKNIVDLKNGEEHPECTCGSTETKPKKDPNNKILRNIYAVIHAKPKIPTPKYVFTRTGTKEDLLPSGMISRFIHSKKFGKTPAYILRFMEEKEHEKQLLKDQELKSSQPACKYVTHEEREKLLKGLKDNWAELQKKYQGLPILTDTTAKILRKTQMEEELAQLEKDIVLVERHPHIYIYNE